MIERERRRMRGGGEREREREREGGTTRPPGIEKQRED